MDRYKKSFLQDDQQIMIVLYNVSKEPGKGGCCVCGGVLSLGALARSVCCVLVQGTSLSQDSCLPRCIKLYQQIYAGG